MSNAQQIIGSFIKNLFRIRKHNMFEVQLPNEQVIARTQTQINAKLAKYYRDPLLKNYLKSLPPKTLLDESVVMYVGSRTRPKNIVLRNQLLQLAKDKAEIQQTKILQNMSNQQKSNIIIKKISNTLKSSKVRSKKQTHLSNNQDSLIKNQPKDGDLRSKEDKKAQQISIPNSDKYLAKYYSHAFTKYESLQSNNPQKWDACTESIQDLADKGHPLSSLQLAKQYYFRIQTESLPKQFKSQLVIQCAQYYMQSVTQTNLNGLYYLAQMLTQFPELHESMQSQIQELYTFSAAYGNPLAYAKLAQIQEKKGNVKLYMKYLKCAAEGGCIEAQHNLGIQYQKGLNVKKDDLKAFAWFKHAGANGFVYAKFNEALMLFHGSECGRIKKNLKAALLQFQQIQRSQTIDVSAEIDSILNDSQIKELMQEAQKQQNSKK